MNYIRTYTGEKFFPFSPTVDTVHIVDIAHALSNTCRFKGHCPSFYSVAQHSVYVSLFVPTQFALWGLLHDSAEAYLTDVARPVKKTPMMAEYRRVESIIMATIVRKFKLDPLIEPQEVKDMDTRMLVTEARDLGIELEPEYQKIVPLNIEVTPMLPMEAEDLFLNRYKELTEH
jgi:hypothetical protein